jgi:predicted ArsR family transcriptional regulator
MDLFSTHDPYPVGPGSKERGGTSEEAAERIASRAETVRLQVLALLRAGGKLTADEIAKKLKLSVLSVRPRVSELAARGLIERTGGRRQNQSGMNAAVWRAKAPQTEELRA